MISRGCPAENLYILAGVAQNKGAAGEQRGNLNLIYDTTSTSVEVVFFSPWQMTQWQAGLFLQRFP